MIWDNELDPPNANTKVISQAVEDKVEGKSRYNTKWKRRAKTSFHQGQEEAQVQSSQKKRYSSSALDPEEDL